MENRKSESMISTDKKDFGFSNFCKSIKETALKPKNFLRANINLQNKEIADQLKIGEEVKITKKDNSVVVTRVDGTVLGYYTLEYEKNGSIILKSKISGIEMKSNIRVDTKVQFANNSYNIQGIEKIELKLKNENNIKLEVTNQFQYQMIERFNNSIQSIACTNIGERVKTNEYLELGQEIYCKRDFNNPYDTNAVEVFTLNGQSIGYLYRICATELACFIDKKLGTVSGKIVKYTPLRERGSKAKKALIDVELKVEKW